MVPVSMENKFWVTLSFFIDQAIRGASRTFREDMVLRAIMGKTIHQRQVYCLYGKLEDLCGSVTTKTGFVDVGAPRLTGPAPGGRLTIFHLTQQKIVFLSEEDRKKRCCLNIYGLLDRLITLYGDTYPQAMTKVCLFKERLPKVIKVSLPKNIAIVEKAYTE